VIAVGSRWRVANEPAADQVEALAAALNLPPLLARLLVQRGYGLPDAAKAFLRPSLQALSDPLAMLPTASSVDLNSSFSVPPLRVTAQAYQLNAFQVGFELNIVNSQPAGVGTTGTCNGSALETLRTKTPNDDSTIVPTCEFTVRTGSATPINVTVDTAGLTALLVSKYDCTTNVYTPPTSAELLPFLQFQCGP